MQNREHFHHVAEVGVRNASPMCDFAIAREAFQRFWPGRGQPRIRIKG